VLGARFKFPTVQFAARGFVQRCVGVVDLVAHHFTADAEMFFQPGGGFDWIVIFCAGLRCLGAREQEFGGKGIGALFCTPGNLAAQNFGDWQRPLSVDEQVADFVRQCGAAPVSAGGSRTAVAIEQDARAVARTPDGHSVYGRGDFESLDGYAPASKDFFGRYLVVRGEP